MALNRLRKKADWPGLRAKDHLSRVVTRWVKEQREEKEQEAWAQGQIVRLLDRVSPDVVVKLLYREARRRKESIPPSPTFLSVRVIRDQMRMGMTT